MNKPTKQPTTKRKTTNNETVAIRKGPGPVFLQILFTINLSYYSMKDFNQGELDSATSSANSLILFYADWCVYCKRFIPIFENSVKNLSDKKILVGGVKLNEDENPLWDKYGINAVPTLIAFSKNTIKDRRDAKMGVGLTKSDMESILSSIGTKM